MDRGWEMPIAYDTYKTIFFSIHQDSVYVSHLNKDSSGKFGMNNWLCNPSGSIRSWSVYFCWILSRKGTPTVCTPSSISIYNDLATCQACICLLCLLCTLNIKQSIYVYFRSSLNKSTAWLDVVNCIIGQQFSRDYSLVKQTHKNTYTLSLLLPLSFIFWKLHPV